jgi:hypothetical protein
MQDYLGVANSPVLFGIVLIPIIVVLVQAVLYIRLGAKRVQELGMPKGTVRKVIINSAVFSVLPSIPIVITLTALTLVLGKYIPWLRLSVIGSAMYESMCADMTIASFGYKGLGDNSITASVFVSVVWVMSAAAVGWPLCNIIGLRLYDKRLKSLQKSSGFTAQAASAMFIGLMAIMAVPRFFNFKTAGGRTGIVVAVVSSIAVVLLDFFAKKTKIKIISDFSFPLAMVMGMITAVVVGQPAA